MLLERPRTSCILVDFKEFPDSNNQDENANRFGRFFLSPDQWQIRAESRSFTVRNCPKFSRVSLDGNKGNAMSCCPA